MSSFEDSLHLLRRELQQAVPLPRILSHLDRLLPLPNFQTEFVRVVRGERVDRSLLMKVSRYLFARFDRIYGKYALNDEFVELFSRLDVSESVSSCDRYYDDIHIRASGSLISEGTTGYSLWDASVALLACLSAYSLCDFFNGKRVLELGSGTGLGGLAVAARSKAFSVHLTDVAQVHDAFTLPNTLLNSHLAHKISTEVVYWNDLAVEPDDFASKFDVVLGCDLVYDPEVVVMLLDALNALILSPSSTIQTAVLFCALRNPQTFDDFILALQDQPRFHLEIEMITDYYDPQSNSIILQSIESFRIVTITINS